MLDLNSNWFHFLDNSKLFNKYLNNYFWKLFMYPIGQKVQLNTNTTN